MRSGLALANNGSQPHNFNSTGQSGSLIQNMVGGGADGASQTIYSTQYQLYLQNLQNNKSKLSEGLQMQSQQNSLLKNHMLSNSFMNNPNAMAPAGRGPLGHHQTEKEMWGGTNLSKEQRLGLAGSIMIGETVASNLQNLSSLPTQNQLQVSSTMGRNIVNQLREQGIAPGGPAQANTEVYQGSNIMKN